jgi:hypothetical protein
MKYLKVTTLNNVYIVSEDDSGTRRIVSSTHPNLLMMARSFIGRAVDVLELGQSMIVPTGHTSTVLSIEDTEAPE